MSMITDNCFIGYLPHREVSNSDCLAHLSSSTDSDSLLSNVTISIGFITTRSREAISSSKYWPLASFGPPLHYGDLEMKSPVTSIDLCCDLMSPLRPVKSIALYSWLAFGEK